MEAFIGVVAVLLVVALLASSTAAAARQNNRKDTTLLVRTDPTTWTQAVLLSITGLSRHSAVLMGSNVLSVRRYSYPGWVIFVAILFFPIGLLALLAKRQDEGVIVSTDRGDGVSHVHLKGYFFPEVIDRVNGVIDLYD